MNETAVPRAIDQENDVVVVGGGPAGLTAGIYLARAMLKPIVFEGVIQSNTDMPGGQLMGTTDVENYPGFVDGIEGPELVGAMRSQAQRFGADILSEHVVEIGVGAGPGGRHLVIGEHSTIATRAVIIATGSKARQLGVPGEDTLGGRGVSTCATCDGSMFRGKDVAVVGGGDSALEEALFLTRYCNTVTLIHRRDNLRASPIMVERARTNKKIHWVLNTTVTAIHGNNSVESIDLNNSDGQTRLNIDGVFIAIGHDPATSIVSNILELDEYGCIAVEGRSSITAIEGLFACGDATDHRYRQAITAAGSGCVAALDAQHWLDEPVAV